MFESKHASHASKHASLSVRTLWSIADAALGCRPLWHTTQDKMIDSCILMPVAIYKSDIV